MSAPAYYQRATGEQSARRIEDERLTGRIREVHRANYEYYGYRRVHAQLVREGEAAGRDQVARLMASGGIRGAKRRGKPWRTTIGDPSAQRASDLVCRDFTAPAPDRLWVGDLTYLRTWEGRLFFAFIVDVYSRMIVGWQLAGHTRTTLGPRRAADGARAPRAGR
ncbi:MAG: IS3 family transposase [Solirubrobacteraceae bacterium]